MMAMVKLFVLFLVVFKATARESFHEDSSYSSPSSLSQAPASSDLEQEKISKAMCIVGCAFTCIGKPSFLKGICMGVCLAKCVLSPSASLDELTCTLDCAHSHGNSLPYDANMMNDLGHSCYQQCKRD